MTPSIVYVVLMILFTAIYFVVMGSWMRTAKYWRRSAQSWHSLYEKETARSAELFQTHMRFVIGPINAYLKHWCESRPHISYRFSIGPDSKSEKGDLIKASITFVSDAKTVEVPLHVMFEDPDEQLQHIEEELAL